MIGITSPTVCWPAGKTCSRSSRHPEPSAPPRGPFGPGPIGIDRTAPGYDRTSSKSTAHSGATARSRIWGASVFLHGVSSDCTSNRKPSRIQQVWSRLPTGRTGTRAITGPSDSPSSPWPTSTSTSSIRLATSRYRAPSSRSVLDEPNEPHFHRSTAGILLRRGTRGVSRKGIWETFKTPAVGWSLWLRRPRGWTGPGGRRHA